MQVLRPTDGAAEPDTGQLDGAAAGGRGFLFEELLHLRIVAEVIEAAAPPDAAGDGAAGQVRLAEGQLGGGGGEREASVVVGAAPTAAASQQQLRIVRKSSPRPPESELRRRRRRHPAHQGVGYYRRL